MRGFKTIKKQPTQPQSQPQYEVADVLNKLGSKLEDLGLNSWQLRTLFALKKCRTSALGGHIDACDECGNISISYNSCRNRHCPKCQGRNREDWIQTRETKLAMATNLSDWLQILIIGFHLLRGLILRGVYMVLIFKCVYVLAKSVKMLKFVGHPCG